MPPTPGTLPSILLVEDDPVSALFLSAALEALPARVRVAGSCAEALASEGAFDVWLIDANLPDGTGTILLQHLRMRDASAAALAHTADTSPAMRDRLRQAGFTDVLPKPLAAQVLQDAVRMALEQRRGEAPPDWDDTTALAALGGNHAHVAVLRQLFLSELPAIQSACLDAFVGGDHVALRAHLHRLQASCGFAGATTLAGIASRWHAAPGDEPLRDAFAAASDRLLSTGP